MDSLPDAITKLPVAVQYAIAALVALGSALGLWTKLQAPVGALMHKLWPGREGWSAECRPAATDEQYRDDERLDPTNAYSKGVGVRWSQMREMQVGDYYQLFLEKRRIVSHIQFVVPGDGYPQKYLLKVMPKSGQAWIEIGKLDGPIDHEFEEPREVQGIRVEVLEPKTEPLGLKGNPPAWSIYDIEITEVRLFGRWCKHVIR